MSESHAQKTDLSVGFTEAWWRERCGLDVTERWFADPEFRAQRSREREIALCRRFGHLGLGSEDPPACPAGLAFPLNLVAEALGLPITYRYEVESHWWPIPLNLDDQAAWDLRPVHDFGSTECAQRLLRELQWLEKRFDWRPPPPGECQGSSGVMNTVLDIRGYQILTDMHLKSELARHVLAVVTETLKSFVDWQCKVLWGGLRPATIGLGNCSDSLISPQTYLDFVFPCDEWLAGSHTQLGIHRDDRLEPYLEAYLRHPKLSAVDCGWDSSVAAIRKVVPAEKYHLNMRIDPWWLARVKPQEIVVQVRAWIEEAGLPRAQFALICDCVDPATPDANIEALFDGVKMERDEPDLRPEWVPRSVQTKEDTKL